MLAAELQRFSQAGGRLELFVTREDKPGGEWADLPAARFCSSSEVDLEGLLDGQEGLVFACGPAPLVRRTELAAISEHLQFHSETFEL